MYDFDARNEILRETHFSAPPPFSLSLSRNVRRNRNSISSAIYERAHGATLARFSTLRAPMIYFPIIYVLPPTRIPGTAVESIGRESGGRHGGYKA